MIAEKMCHVCVNAIQENSKKLLRLWSSVQWSFEGNEFGGGFLVMNLNGNRNEGA